MDTGPLISILILKYAFTLQPDAAEAAIAKSRIQPYLRNDGAQKAMIRLFDQIREIMTTSHVIGELQGLQSLKGDSQKAFWRFSMDWLKSKSLDEKLVGILDLNSQARSQNWVCEVGPTDSGLLELARREGAVLLTDDRRTLAGYGLKKDIDCRLVQDLLDEEVHRHYGPHH